MPKYALIQNIGGLICLLCHLLHFRRFSGHFVEPGLYRIYHLILHTINNAKVGICDAGQTWARPILPNASNGVAIHIYVYSIFPTCQ